MDSYIVMRMPEGARAASLSGVFTPEAMPEVFLPLNRAPIGHYPWDENGYKPESWAVMGWNALGLHVLLYSHEPIIRAELHTHGGRSCEDSCLECFLMPAPDISSRYVNIEITPHPAVHIGLGDGRHGRTVLSAPPEGFNVTASRHDGAWWAISYTIPAAFLAEHFGFSPHAGARMRGNFSKCGDSTAYPHFGQWHPYADLPAADFHRPELFGEMVLA